MGPKRKFGFGLRNAAAEFGIFRKVENDESMKLFLMKRLIEVIAIGLLMVPLVLFGIPHFQRPPQTPESRSLFQGVMYRREFIATPQPVMMHTVTVDLTAPGIGVFVTPGTATPDLTETNARTPSEFLTEFNLQLAVNANFFYPFKEKTFWDFYPYSGDRVNAVGQAISNGTVYSDDNTYWAALCFDRRHRAHILASGKCPIGTAQAVAGRLLVQNGRPIPQEKDAPDNDRAYSRTIAAIDQSGQTLWLIAVDDKQPLYSQGIRLDDVAQVVAKLGADVAINLDGGGSTTLVAATPRGPKVLNAPVHTKIPMRERPVANHLGIYALRIGN